MIVRSLISLAIPALSGFFLVDILLKRPPAGLFGFLFKACLAVGAGFGVSSALFFIWLEILGSSGAGLISFAVIETVFLAILWALWRSRAKNTSESLFKDPGQGSEFDIVSLIFCGIFIVSVIDIVILSIASPHGYWDAWSIWNMRARFIFRAGQYWTDAFSAHLSWSHTDYPLLVPLSVARCWKYAGYESVVMPILTAGFFCMATIGIMTSSLSLIYDKQRGSLAGLILLGTPFFIVHSASQYADIPLAFYMLAALALLCMYDRNQENTGLLFLAGLLSGLAAWTKNEGALFLAGAAIGQFFAVVPGRGWKPYLARMGVFFKGALPILLILAYYKLRLALAGDLFAADRTPAAILGGIIDLRRWLFIAGEFCKEGARFGKWPGLFIPALALSAVFFSIKISQKDKANITGTAVSLAVILLGYYFIFLITPHDVAWHLSTSLDRLFLQIWPAAVFLFFQLVALPERIA